jgi:hypothetical protein
MDLLMADHHDAGTFCREFERTYNLEIDKTQLTDVEREAFSKLFDKIAWYSPFPHERQAIPRYLSGAQIRQAVGETRSALEARQ